MLLYSTAYQHCSSVSCCLFESAHLHPSQSDEKSHGALSSWLLIAVTTGICTVTATQTHRESCVALSLPTPSTLHLPMTFKSPLSSHWSAWPQPFTHTSTPQASAGCVRLCLLRFTDTANYFCVVKVSFIPVSCQGLGCPFIVLWREGAEDGNTDTV